MVFNHRWRSSSLRPLLWQRAQLVPRFQRDPDETLQFDEKPIALTSLRNITLICCFFHLTKFYRMMKMHGIHVVLSHFVLWTWSKTLYTVVLNPLVVVAVAVFIIYISYLYLFVYCS